MNHGSDIGPTDGLPTRAASGSAVAAALEARFGSSLTPAMRDEIANQAIDRYRDASVQSFVTILAQRFAIEIASDRLRAAG